MKLLTDLFYKAYTYDLHFQYFPMTKAIYIRDSNLKEISYGALKNMKHETPEETLHRMHEEVEEYMDLVYEDDEIPFDADYQTEEARAKLTEQERAMKEAGHKLSDFM